MKVAVGSDHGGFRLKEFVKGLLEGWGYQVLDFGTFSEESVDYPEYALKVVRAVLSGEAERGVLVCGTGIGMSIVANRFPGIRAALCHDPYTAKMSRLHNDANILALGGRVIGEGEAEEILRVWFEAGFEGGRHARRLGRIEEIEETMKEGGVDEVFRCLGR